MLAWKIMYHISALLCLAALYDASHESKIVVGDVSVLLNIPREPGVKKKAPLASMFEAVIVSN